MNKGITNILVSVILVVIALVLAPLVVDSVHDVQTDPATEVFADEATGVGVTSVTVQLAAPGHYHTDSTLHITVTSSNASDTPTATSYTSSTRNLVVGGLAESDTRDLTVSSETGALADYAGADAIVGLTPLLYIVGILALAVGNLWRTFA